MEEEEGMGEKKGRRGEGGKHLVLHFLSILAHTRARTHAHTTSGVLCLPSSWIGCRG